ncbi:MAG: DUF2333 family protein [Gammaproteobacteria bacterium]
MPGWLTRAFTRSGTGSGTRSGSSYTEPAKTGRRRVVIAGAAALGVWFAGAALVGLWWSDEPEVFNTQIEAKARAAARGHRDVPGYTTTATVIGMGRTLLDKPGGYLSNDLMPPGIWLDNIPNWEFGVLTQLRDASRAFRIDFSRSQSQSSEDPDLAVAEGKFFFDNSSWAFPPSEREYEDGIALFEHYLDRLAGDRKPKARFYARADNLNQWLQGVETRLGSLSQRLSASVGKRALLLDGSVMPGPQDGEVRTPWSEIDDVFYEARGQAWALIHLLHALEHDFADVLADKNARVSLQQIIRELEPTQDTVMSPFILNGSGMGLLANHSLVMASYLSRANAGINDLRKLLAQG